MTDADVTRIAEFLNLSEPEFVERYTALRADRRGLTLTSKENDECVFLDGIECTINPVKPEQCAGFPNTWNFPGWRKYCEAIPIPVVD